MTQTHVQIRALVISLCLGWLFNSCSMPTQDNPMVETFSDINIISIDGSGHRIISPQRSEYLHLLLTQYGIVFGIGNFSLYTMNYDGAAPTQLYPSIQWGDRCSSPDETTLVMTSLSLENNKYSSSIYLMNGNGTNLVQLAAPKGIYNFAHISPNLDEIAFMRDGGIATMNIDGTNLQWISTKTDSTWSIIPVYLDQNRILYTEGGSTTLSLKLFDKSRRQTTFIDYLSIGIGYDGRSIVRRTLVYTYLNAIKVLDIDKMTYKYLTNGIDPSFSSDGAKIVFRDDRSIYTINADGSDKRTIYTESDSSRHVATPQYSPDGKTIIFLTSYTVVGNR